MPSTKIETRPLAPPVTPLKPAAAPLPDTPRMSGKAPGLTTTLAISETAEVTLK